MKKLLTTTALSILLVSLASGVYGQEINNQIRLLEAEIKILWDRNNDILDLIIRTPGSVVDKGRASIAYRREQRENKLEIANKQAQIQRLINERARPQSFEANQNERKSSQENSLDAESLIHGLSRLGEMHEQGILNEEEFSAAKKQLLELSATNFR